MKRFRVLAPFLALVMPLMLRAEPGVMTAPEAAAARAAGEVIRMDVRTSDEWAATDMPAGAVPAFAGGPGLHARFSCLLEIANGCPVGMICATGARSGFAAAELDWLRVSSINVPEGMSGSAVGPGWVSRGLPFQAATRHIFEEQLSGLERDAESPGDEDMPQ